MSLHPRTPAPEAWRLAQHRETTATGAADFTCRKQGNGTTFIEHALGGEQQQALTRACLRLPLTLSHACQPDGRVGATRCLVRREMDDEDDKGDEHEVQGACEGAGVRNLLAAWRINILSGHNKVEGTTAASVQPHLSGKCQMHDHASALLLGPPTGIAQRSLLVTGEHTAQRPMVSSLRPLAVKGEN